MGKFKDIYSAQVKFQKKVEGLITTDHPAHSLPYDDPRMFQYHVTALQEEIGEVLKADKRWKTHRNTTFIPEEKLDEVADVFISAINISIWSGYSADDILGAIKHKIEINNNRISKEE